MNFAYDNIGKRHLLTGIWIALAGLGIEIPIVIDLTIIKPHPIRVGFLLGDVVFASSVAILLIVQALLLRKTDRIILTPIVVFVSTCLTAIATGFLQVAAGGSDLLFIPILSLCMLYLTLVGDTRMRRYGLVLIVLVILSSTWLTGLRSRQFISAAMLNSSVVVIVFLMGSLGVTSVIESFSTESLLRKITDFDDQSKSILEALDFIVPIIAELPYVYKVTALTSSKQGTSIISSFPSIMPEDTLLIDNPALFLAIKSVAPIRSGSKIFIPGGVIETGDLILVLDVGKLTFKKRLRLQELGQGLMTPLIHFTARIQHLNQLELTAKTDPLTGLSNRRVLFERLEVELTRAERSEKGLSIAMMDLDYFKTYNDTFGHQSGDEALKVVASVLSTRLRSQDLLSRYGGEEFCLLMPDTTLNGALNILEKLRLMIKETKLLNQITVSSGVTHTFGYENSDRVLKRADDALYNSKRSGRDKVSYLSGPDIANLSERPLG